MSRLKVVGLGIVFAGFAGCTDPVIDTSNEASIKTSVAEVRERLPEEKRNQFDEALQVLIFGQFDMEDVLGEGDVAMTEMETRYRAALAGKTAEEVIAQAEVIVEERKERERRQALAEIEELKASQAEAQKTREQLQKFRVIRSRFYKREQEFGRDQPVIELTVKNETIYPIAHAYFRGTVASPERSVPWLQESFNYSISGGVEPGEEATWNLAPNSYSEWGRVDAPSDAVLTVTVERLDGADGEALFSARDFSERDQRRLERLQEQYGGE